MVQVNRVCLKILFINRPQFLVDSNEGNYKGYSKNKSKYYDAPS